MAIATMRELLEAGIHFGHQTRRWHPKMARYIFGQRNGIYIIDLQQTLRQIYRSYALVRDTVANGGTVLFVGTKRQAQEAVQREAERCGMYWVTNRWLGGTLTNYQTVRRSIADLKHLQELESSGDIEQYPKKEQVMMRKRREKLEKNLAGIQDMPGLPKVMFVIDAKREAIAVREAERLEIPCIGIVDTNCDPDIVSLPIPGNDDAIRAVGLFCKIIADAVMEGKMRHEKVRAEQEQTRTAAREGDDTEDEAAPETTRDQGPAAAVAAATPADTEAAAVLDESRDQAGAQGDAAGDVPETGETAADEEE